MRPLAPSLTALLLGVATLLPVGAASASPEYPGKLAELLDMGCVPQCTICHQTNAGGIGSLKDDSFGAAMAELADLEEEQPEKIAAALAVLEQPDVRPPFGVPEEPIDSDRDGMGGVEELRQMRNPNESGEGSDICGPLYGCGAAVAPPRVAAEGRTLPLLAALATALALAARARRP